jgi:hypothetical protein
MIDKAMAIFQKVGDWFLMEHDTYIRVYGPTKYPHLVPGFIPKKFVF